MTDRSLVLAVLVALSACVTTSANKCLLDRPDVNPKRYISYQGRSLNLTVDTSNRATHILSSHVFRIFMKEVLGYSAVELIINEDNFQEPMRIIGDRLSTFRNSGGIAGVPPALVNLEVWVSPEQDVKPHLLHVSECGNVGPPGRFGWFIPTTRPSNITEYYWSQFQIPETAAMFDITGENWKIIREGIEATKKSSRCLHPKCINGVYVPDQCKSIGNNKRLCGVLLAPHFKIADFVIQHIQDLNLNVKVVFLGDNFKKIVRTLVRKYTEQKYTTSLVILSWTPSDIINEGVYKSVVFPKCGHSDIIECQYEQYEMTRLVKYAWSKLEVLSKNAFEAIQNFMLFRENYHDLLTMYNSNSDKSVEEIACQWMRENAEYWELWMPKNTANVIYIGGIFPMTGSTYTAKGIVTAAEMAVEAINRTSLLYPNELSLLVHDGQCKADVVLKTFIDYIIHNYYSNLVGVLGPACSDTVEPLAGVSKHFRTLVVSYSAEGASFSDRNKYPYFFRTIGENKQYQYVYYYLLKKLGWKRVAALTEDGQKYTEYISHMQELIEKNGIMLIANMKFPREKTQSMIRYLEDLKQKRARIIIADVYDAAARSVMCAAHELGMTAKQGYVWFLPLWLSQGWYDTTRHNAEGENITCSTEVMLEAINGHFGLAHAAYAPDDSMMQENITVAEWRSRYASRCNMGSASTIPVGLDTEDSMSSYAGYAYDAVWTYALALGKLIKEDPIHLADLHSNATTTRLVDIIKNTDFQGVSGRIKFRGGPSRFSVVHIMQWVDNDTRIIGSFYPNISETMPEVTGGTLDLNTSAIVWLNGGFIPDDGSSDESDCAFRAIADGLNIQCSSAIVLVNLGFSVGLLAVLIAVAYMIIKKRYEDKLIQSHKYMKSFGIDLLSGAHLSDLDKWEVSRDKVVINRKLGEGAFGTVFGGEAQLDDKGWTAIAVKTLKVGSNTDEKLDFLSEAESMKRFDHKNIIKLLGVCTKNEPVYTIMEFMLYGDLKTFLLARRHIVNDKLSDEADEISSKKLTQMALDVASALSYLAELKYVHRDVACRNCLINAQRVVKLSDFGMTRPMFENDYYKFNRKGMLPVRWMAPESLGLGVFTPASDVWSYGVLLYEIITFGSFPFQGMTNSQVLEHVKAGNTLKIPQGVKPQLEGLMKSCWNLNHKTRPQASEIVHFMSNYPRMLSPCLDVPLASVQMADDTLEMIPDPFSQSSPSPNDILVNTNVDAYHRDDTSTHSGGTPYKTAVLQPLIPNGGTAANSNASLKQLLSLYNLKTGDSGKKNGYCVRESNNKTTRV